MITKDKAREVIENITAIGYFPIFDCIAFREEDKVNGISIEYTFRQLLCIVYDLERKELKK